MATSAHLPTKLLALAAGLFVATALVQAPLTRAAPSIPKLTTTSSVVRTKNIQQTRAVLKKYSLKETKTVSLPKGGALITVDAPINSTSAQLLQKDLQSDPQSTLLPVLARPPAPSPAPVPSPAPAPAPAPLPSPEPSVPPSAAANTARATVALPQLSGSST